MKDVELSSYIKNIGQQENDSSVVSINKSEMEQNTTAFDKFFELGKYELLYKELKKRGITTFEDLRKIHLWPFMNFHQLYPFQQRLEISIELTAMLKSAENKNADSDFSVFEICYNGVTYKGASPSEAFVEFLAVIAKKYPLKIRSLLDCIHPETGKVVVSGNYSDKKLRMINPDAYVEADLSSERVEQYVAWVIERCGASPREYAIKENGKSIEASAKSYGESECTKSGGNTDASAGDISKEENQLDKTPAHRSICDPNLSLTQEVEGDLLKCDLTGATYDELQGKLHESMAETKRFVGRSPYIIEMNKRLYHVDALVDFEEGADTLEAVLDKLMKKNNSIATAKQLYEYARSEMAMFFNDNGMTEQQSVYDFARYLFEKMEYHGKKYVFRANMYISLPEVSADSVVDVMKKYAREKGSTVTFMEMENYLTGMGLNTGNLRGLIRIDKEPVFLIYAENEYLLAELMHIDDAFLKVVHSALRRLFSDCNGYIIPRNISNSWYNLLPPLPASLSWTPMLLQQLICFYQDELEAKSIIAMETQNSNTLHTMFVEKESWIQDFRDVVAVFLHDEMPARSEFDAEELRKILVDAGMISGNQLIRNMNSALGGDDRFLWNSDGSHVKVRM